MSAGTRAGGAVRVGLVGLGNSGWYYHAEQNLEPARAGGQLELVAVCDADPARAAAAAERFGARAHTDWRALVALEPERGGVELVVVALPHHLHRDVVTGALEAGRHVHVEKPMATSRADADAMLAAARAAGRQLSVHQQRRWEPDFQRVLQLVREGAVGPVRRVEVHRSHAGRYRTAGDGTPHTGDDVATWTEGADTGGGVGWLIGPHPVDQVLQLLGPPSGVTGTAHRPPGSDVEDHLRIDLVFEQRGISASARIDVHREAEHAAPRFRVVGERGDITSEDGTAVVVRDAGGAVVVVHDGLEPPGRLGAELYASLAASLRGGPPVAVPGEQGRDVVDVLERALAPAGSGRRTVKVAIAPADARSG
ncbi:Gfo/Idh/MocA family protein [Streptomyces sp. NP160]|uniref:Gfo/Idh/MocA family protein n=1 Tax=Streptomyces sp. NP160 TaxID=2586637 RepID=UPI0015D592D3|nr:Gfo/Idh/MocA family oxidoreductase [Streptomyces sp. NP160]